MGRIIVFMIIPILLISLTIGVVSLIKYYRGAGKFIDFSRMTGDNITFNGNGFLNYKEKTLKYYDCFGKSKDFSRSLGFDDDNIKLAGGSEITVLYNDISFFVVGTKQAVNIENGRIIDCKCGKNFAALLIKDNESANSRVEIYNSAGSLCNKKEFDTTIITGFGFESEFGTTFYYSEMSTAGKDLAITITTFDLERNSVNGVLCVYGMVVDDVIFTENSIFVVGTKYIIRFDRVTNKEVYRILIYGYEFYSVSMNNKKKQVFALAEADVEKPAYVKLLTLSESENANSTVRVINLPDDYVYFASMKGSLAVVTDHSVIKYDAYGKVSGTTECDGPISKAMKLDSNKMLVKNGEKYCVFKLK